MFEMGHGWVYYLIVALQIICCVHAFRARQPFWWFLFIIFIPPIGPVVYLLLFGRNFVPVARVLPSLKIPLIEKLNERKIERLYHESDTLDNRIDFANVLINRGESQRAVELLQEALRGPLKNNVILLFAAARAYYAVDHIDDAINCLQQAETIANNERLKQRHLLLAMCYELQGDSQRAEQYYKDSLVGTMSEESKTRYGLFLRAQNRHAEAIETMRKVLQSVKSAPWSYRREQGVWISQARETIRELEQDVNEE